MDQATKNRTKKYLCLLKQAQNTAFADLVVDNLKVELQSKPHKIMKILDFIVRDLSVASSDFTRLKINESLIPALGQVMMRLNDKFVQSVEDQLNQEDEKLRSLAFDKLQKSILCLNIEDPLSVEKVLKQQLSYINFTQLVKSNNIFTNLIDQYQPLLAEDNFMEVDSGAQSKDNIKKMVMENMIGVKTDKLKLSDFIDESFFEDLDNNPKDQKQGTISKDANKTPISELINQMTSESGNSLFEIPIVNKRQKTSKVNGTLKQKMLILSPALALALYATEKLLSTDWKQRQSSSVILNCLLKQNNLCFDYHTLQQDPKTKKYTLGNNKVKVEKDKMLQNIFPRLFILILKDHFCDFEELKVLTPAREEAIQLFITCQNCPELHADIVSLINQLPLILKSVETETWIGRYNFFLILKGLLQQHKEKIFNMFNKVLIESLLQVEDEVRIVVTELIEQLLPFYLQRDDKYKTMSILLNNLSENLQQSDEIECSAISVFNLIFKIFDTLPELEKLDFKINLNIFCPFNFHKLVNVRYYYNQIMNKCLTSFKFSIANLNTLMTLTIQSLLMENSRPLVKMLFANLKLIISHYPTDTEDFAQLIQSKIVNNIMPWMYQYQIETFDDFEFYESKNFESINKDYYKIIYKPTTYEEIDAFYYRKMSSMTRVLAALMTHSPQAVDIVIGNFLQQFNQGEQEDPPIFEGHFLYLLTFSQYLKTKPGDEFPYYQQINDNTIGYLQNLTEDYVSIHGFRDIQNLEVHYQLLNQLVEKHQLQSCFEPLNQFSQLIAVCFQTLKLTNLNLIQQQFNVLIVSFDQFQEFADVIECFKVFTTLLTSLFNYASTLINRIKCISSCIQVQLTLLGKTQLTTQLNCLVKPLLTGTKLSKIRFIQKLYAKHIIELVEILQAQNKLKSVQCIMGEIVKKLEQVGSDETCELGNAAILRYMMKRNDNIFTCYKQYLADYFFNQISVQNAQSWVKAIYFILDNISKNEKHDIKVYQNESAIIQKHISLVLTFGIEITDLSNLVLLTFKLFPSQQVHIVSTLVKQMDNKSKIAFECLNTILDSQNNDVMKFIPVFIIPVIKNIQYSRTIFNNDKQITLILAKLLQLLPLNLATINDIAEGKSSNVVDDLKELAQEGYSFLQIFCSNQMVTEYKLSIPVKAQLRDYQRQGITWLASLGRYNLNCALCDDMGLGKTLQSLCVILNESFLKQQITNVKPTNLIICPTSITHNWQYEIQKFFDGFKSIVYEGSSVTRMDIIKNASKYDIIIGSYDNIRNDIKAFKTLQFFYVVLDEAHIIKNAKAKRTQAVKALNCEKKLILTGTPLQNRVSELWSIFDFLMPGFLEEENVFNKKYNQYLSTNIKKLSEKLEETQSFLDALKSLKKRISPFILRRTKQDVLKELPPKIIQDYPCKMTDFQEYVHKLVEKNHPISQVLSQEQDQKKTKGGNQILGNLILHRQVCNHPILVTKNFQSDKNVTKYLSTKSERDMFKQSGKLQGLVDLLIECEIIESGEEKEETKQQQHTFNHQESQSGSLLVDMAFQTTNKDSLQKDSSKHRVLIFCQMNSFMNMIKTDVLDRFGINYLQLLSAHSSKDRVDICNKFNSEEQIQVLLLTTTIGGLGLNLTGADTVIFAEHDWNPMKDLQAIDRAHRLGQTKTVNVYRLIVSNTLEEKIMSLQRFKQNLAKSLVQAKGVGSEDASSLEMSDLLKSFEEHSSYQDGMNKAPQIHDKIVSGLEEIWQTGKFEEM